MWLASHRSAFVTYLAFGLVITASGSCNFPASFQNRFWFRFFSYNSNSLWVYRLFQPDAVVDWPTNSSRYLMNSGCQDLNLISQTQLYYLTSDSYCAAATLTSDGSTIMTQELDVSKNRPSSASQCVQLLSEACLQSGQCSATWMPAVNSLTAPPIFSSAIQCPFQGVYQLGVDLGAASNICSADPQSTAAASGSTIQMNVCTQSNLNTVQFKQGNTLLRDNITCMAQLPGSAINSDETGSQILLLRDQTSLFCARYQTDSSGNLLLAINIKNLTSAYCGPMSFSASTGSDVLLLRLTQMPSTTSTVKTTIIPILLPTTILPTSIPTSSTPVTFPGTPTLTSTASSTASTTASSSTGTTASSTTSTSDSSSTAASSSTSASTSTVISIKTTPATTASTSTTTGNLITTPTGATPTISTISNPTGLPGSGSTTKGGGGGGGGPPAEINVDNCAVNECGRGANCDATTGNCRCKTFFYRYNSNSSRCAQDDASIDDTFLKIVVPIIVISALGSLIAGLALCLCASPLSTSGAADAGATLAAASKAATAAPAAAQGPDPVFVSYGKNLDTYANIDSVDKGLVTYGYQSDPQPAPNPRDNFIMVGSTIPLKM